MCVCMCLNFCLQVAGTSGKALLEGGSDDEGSSTEAHGRAIIEVLGREKRDEILSALYMVRTDVSISVRQVILDYKLGVCVCICNFFLLKLHGLNILLNFIPSGCSACLENHSRKYSKDFEGNNAGLNEYSNIFSSFIIF